MYAQIRISYVCFCYTHIGTELHKPTKDTVNPVYHTVTDDCKKPVEEPVSYEDVNKPPEVKMTQNPSYAISWIVLWHSPIISNDLSYIL